MLKCRTDGQLSHLSAGGTSDKIIICGSSGTILRRDLREPQGSTQGLRYFVNIWPNTVQKIIYGVLFETELHANGADVIYHIMSFPCIINGSTVKVAHYLLQFEIPVLIPLSFAAKHTVISVET